MAIARCTLVVAQLKTEIGQQQKNGERRGAKDATGDDKQTPKALCCREPRVQIAKGLVTTTEG